MDFSHKIQLLNALREDTPAVASVPHAPNFVFESAVETIQQAKESEFPVVPKKKVQPSHAKGSRSKK